MEAVCLSQLSNHEYSTTVFVTNAVGIVQTSVIALMSLVAAAVNVVERCSGDV